MKLLIPLTTLCLALGCSSGKVCKWPPKGMQEATAELNGAPSKALMKNPRYKNSKVKPLPKIRKGAYNIQGEIYKVVPKQEMKELSFQEIDNKNGYARMSGKMDGYYEFFLFVGPGKNLLVKVGWGCGPECSQIVSFYEVQNKSQKQIALKDVLSKKLQDSLGKRLPNCSIGQKFNAWNNKCLLMLESVSYTHLTLPTIYSV